MTVREKGYFHWDGELRPAKFPWWPIARLGIRLSFKKKNFRALYIGAFIPALVFMVGIYISKRIEDFKVMIKDSASVLTVNPAYFKTYYSLEFLLFMMVMLLVVGGAHLISDDLKYNSLQLYFSRPLGKNDYLRGKAAILVFFLLSLTVVPGVIFILLEILFSASFRFLGAYPWLPLAVLAYSALVTLFFCLYGLFLSSLSKNRRYVSILIFAVYVFSDILFGFFYGNFKQPAFALLSLKANLQQVCAWAFRQKTPYAVGWYWSLGLLLGLCVLAYLGLRKKVRGVEVVK